MDKLSIQLPGIEVSPSPGQLNGQIVYTAAPERGKVKFVVLNVTLTS